MSRILTRLRAGLARVVPLLLVAAVGALARSARADVVYQSDDPFCGLFGVEGVDVEQDQSVAVQFIPNGEFTLSQLQLWLWSDDTLGGHPRLIVQLCNDDSKDNASRPGKTIYERWEIDLPTTGLFDAQLFDFPSLAHPPLHAGQRYWIVVESNAPGGLSPVWACAQPHPGFFSVCHPPEPWYAGQSGEAGAMTVLGTRGPTPALTGAGQPEE